jgi:hypothetical protein
MQMTFDLKDDLAQQLKKIPSIDAFVNQVINKALQSQVNTKKSSDLCKAEDAWVHVEKYLQGKIVDMGGKTKANIHLELKDGALLIIATTQKLLEQSEKNHLYRPALLHVTAEENLSTGELREYKLLSFENYQPSYNEDEFNNMVERGTKAWKNVPNGNKWLETLRGNQV